MDWPSDRANGSDFLRSHIKILNPMSALSHSRSGLHSSRCPSRSPLSLPFSLFAGSTERRRAHKVARRRVPRWHGWWMCTWRRRRWTQAERDHYPIWARPPADRRAKWRLSSMTRRLFDVALTCKSHTSILPWAVKESWKERTDAENRYLRNIIGSRFSALLIILSRGDRSC
jgi:hypothetical protein